MTARRLLVVDVESSGLRPTDVCVEVSWWDLGTDERGTFIPRHSVRWVLENGQPEALELNGYRDRIADAKQDNGSELARLHTALRGQRFAGANPTFDTRHMERLFRASGMHPDPWHHRLADGLDPDGRRAGHRPGGRPARPCGVLRPVGCPAWGPQRGR